MNVKRYLYVLFAVCLTGISCQKGFFDQVPDDRLTEDEVFQRRLDSERYLANVYNYVKDESDQVMFDRIPWLGISDEGDVTYATMPTYQINLGNWDAGTNLYNFWPHYYAGIRSATYYMQNIGRNSEILSSAGGEQLIILRKAEARALRAWFYASLLKQYGPVIIIPGDEVIPVNTPSSEINRPRNTYDECVAFIVSELDKAAKDLPLWYDNPLDYGRMNQVVCMAIKARLLLYAASPLWNGNTEYANFKNKDGEQLVSQQYDPEKWKRAADAAKAIIDLNLFNLYKEYNASGDLDPFLSYQNVLLEEWNQEIIFARKNAEIANPSGRSWEWRCSPRFVGGTAGYGPTQQLVDAYQMANGERAVIGYSAGHSPIINPLSGYKEEGFSTDNGQYTEAGTWNMYVGREPRFYVSIAYNGSYWVNKADFSDKVGLYFTGNTGKNSGANNFSRTGYLIRKNVHPKSNLRTKQMVKRPLVLFRLAEIYLNYAEALNEYNPGDADVVRYVNLIRERAGLVGLPTGLSKEDMRERILLERRLELAFERHRSFDTRRWKIAEHTDGGPFYGMDVDAGQSLDDPAFYKRVVFETRVFTKKHYLFPIPQSEIDRNDNLIQNPEW